MIDYEGVCWKCGFRSLFIKDGIGRWWCRPCILGLLDRQGATGFIDNETGIVYEMEEHELPADVTDYSKVAA